MGITKLTDSAFFVPSYSLQTITVAYDTTTTIQSLSASEVDAQQEDARQPIQSEDGE
jgi:hypothetical protein